RPAGEVLFAQFGHRRQSAGAAIFRKVKYFRIFAQNIGAFSAFDFYFSETKQEEKAQGPSFAFHFSPFT
ncbi:MAG: hypothetical protein K2P00_01560, partial [Alistipes sp.]|nr:hypothetical protein [Alistipes sp.]